MAIRLPAGTIIGGKNVGGRFASITKLPPDVIRSIEKTAPAILKREYDKIIPQRFKEIKQEMISEFLDHPVTQEILAGPDADNTSLTLGGFSNLFAFIGFDYESDPLQPILNLLADVSIKQTSVGRRATINYKVDMPTAQDIFNVTPMPWASGRSWAKGIESGISGLGYLIRSDAAASRSGAAIQIKNKVRTGKYKPVPYISSFIKKYQKRFSELE